LSEPLSCELYRMAGVPAPFSEHLRIWMDSRLLGYHELIEQPNKTFLMRNEKEDDGNLYKLLWYGNGVIGKHEKKTNRSTGHEDLLQLIRGLKRKGATTPWEFIDQNFNVDEVAGYFAVNQCIQNWDGFFNNYFAYHRSGKGGRWEMIPWDEDKTWGDYDGASPKYDWYEMPLTFGMEGDHSPSDLFNHYGSGPFGGVSWWRPPGFFSGPLLVNPEFRKKFLARLRDICETAFTEEKLLPVIDALEKRLEPEIRVRADAIGEDSRQALKIFHSDIQSFRNQVQHRRKFILSELGKMKS
jgi:spore coat protein CotH